MHQIQCKAIFILQRKSRRSHENTRFWAKDIVEYMSELDSMQCRGITEENEARGEKE